MRAVVQRVSRAKVTVADEVADEMLIIAHRKFAACASSKTPMAR
jgi:D-Tyr-tRNAtyr deacylase